jgi:hypothetical protein
LRFDGPGRESGFFDGAVLGLRPLEPLTLLRFKESDLLLVLANLAL